ncbi:MAG: hypothetical protein Q8R36_04540 [bacterium]|nr:hypothetical protein [bacterium]
MPNIEIIPALMPRTFEELREQMERFIGLAEIVQLDVMDGVFVKNTSWPYSEDKDSLKNLIEGGDAIPFWEDIDFEVDLMIANPEQEIRNWILYGASRIIVHVESVTDMDFIIAEIKDSLNGKQLDGEDERGIEIGIAINVDTPNKAIEPWIYAVDFIQCMGIAKIGFQGERFDERVISKIEDLRELNPDVTISVDGGVNFESAPKLIAAGATRLVSGSTILQSSDPVSVIERLKNL